MNEIAKDKWDALQRKNLETLVSGDPVSTVGPSKGGGVALTDEEREQVQVWLDHWAIPQQSMGVAGDLFAAVGRIVAVRVGALTADLATAEQVIANVRARVQSLATLAETAQAVYGDGPPYHKGIAFAAAEVAPLLPTAPTGADNE